MIHGTKLNEMLFLINNVRAVCFRNIYYQKDYIIHGDKLSPSLPVFFATGKGHPLLCSTVVECIRNKIAMKADPSPTWICPFEFETLGWGVVILSMLQYFALFSTGSPNVKTKHLLETNYSTYSTVRVSLSHVYCTGRAQRYADAVKRSAAW